MNKLLENETDTFIIAEDEAGERLDKILAARFSPHYSRTYFQYLIDEKLVSVNGEPVKKRLIPEIGDEVEIHFALTRDSDVTPEQIPLDILYEDDDILVINKPAGMVVHPAPGNWTGTFVNGLLYHVKSLTREPNDVRPGIVHRLDKETSGVLVAAKTEEAQRNLIAQFASRLTKKEYVAICVGSPGTGEISRPIGRSPKDRKKMAILEGGKEAITRYKTVRGDGPLYFVRLQPLTGRTHQIRVHLKELNCPVLGDSLYGSESANRRYQVVRHLLHAERLTLKHPRKGEILTFHAPLPQDMSVYASTAATS